MKNPFYYVSLVAALILLATIAIVLNPNVDRNRSMVVVGLAMGVLAIHALILLLYPFFQTRNFASLVKTAGFVSMFSIVVLAVFDPPNLAVKIFVPIESKSADLQSPSTH